MPRGSGDADSKAMCAHCVVLGSPPTHILSRENMACLPHMGAVAVQLQTGTVGFVELQSLSTKYLPVWVLSRPCWWHLCRPSIHPVLMALLPVITEGAGLYVPCGSETRTCLPHVTFVEGNRRKRWEDGRVTPPQVRLVLFLPAMGIHSLCTCVAGAFTCLLVGKQVFLSLQVG